MINNIDLTEKQKERQAFYREFVEKNITPVGNEIDQEQMISRELIKKMVDNKMWGAEIPVKYGGVGLDMSTYGLLSEIIGMGCANIRNILGVQGMVSTPILKWGNEEQRKKWLPLLASGEKLAAFALTEPRIGSDAKRIETTAREEGDFYILNGKKKWITLAEAADIYLVFAHENNQIGAFLMERNAEGLTVKPQKDLLGFRGSMLAELDIVNCKIPKENLVSKVGFGLNYVAHQGLSFGRFSTAWGCVGLAQACLEENLKYSSIREQFGVPLKSHQLIQEKIANAVSSIMASRLMCYRVGELMDKGDARYLLETSIAKYHSSIMASKIASETVQIHGANGCGLDYNASRHFRDAKIMEIVEGSTEILQSLIAKEAYQTKI